MNRTHRLWRASALGVALTTIGLTLAEAQERPPSSEPAEQDAAAILDEKTRRENDLRSLEDALAASAEARRRLEAEIAEIRLDRAKLNAALIAAAERFRSAEDRVRALEARL